MADPADNRTQGCVKHTGNQNRAEQGGNATGFHDADHDRHEGKAGSLHHREPRTNRTEANCLEQCCHTGEQHRHLDKEHHVSTAKSKSGGARNDNRRCHVTGKHRQNML